MPSGAQRPFARFARYRGRKRPVELQSMTAAAGAGTNCPPRRRYLVTQSVYRDKLMPFEKGGKENYLQPEETDSAPPGVVYVKTKISDTCLTPENGCDDGQLTNFSRIFQYSNTEALDGDKGTSQMNLEQDPSIHPCHAQLMSKHPARSSLTSSPRRRRPCWDRNWILPSCENVAQNLVERPSPCLVQIPNEPPSHRQPRELNDSQSCAFLSHKLHKNQNFAGSVQSPTTSERQVRRESNWDLNRDVRNDMESDGHEVGSQRNRQIHVQPSPDVSQMTGTGVINSEIWRKKEHGNEQNKTLQPSQFPNHSQIAVKARTQSGDFWGTTATKGSLLSMPALQMRGQARQPNVHTPQSPIRHHSKLTYFDDIRILNAWDSLAERPNSCSYAALALDVTNTANGAGTGPALRVAVVEHRMRMLREAFDDIIYLSLQGCIKPGSEGDHFTFFKELQMIVLKSREARKSRREISIARKGDEMANPRGRRRLFLGGVPIGEISRCPQDITLLQNVRARFKFGSIGEKLKKATSENPHISGIGHTPSPEGELSRKETSSANGSASAQEQVILLEKVSNGNCPLIGTKGLHVRRDGSLQEESVGHTVQERRKIGKLKTGKKVVETKKLSASGTVGTGLSANSHVPSCDSTAEVEVEKLSKGAKDMDPRRVVCGSVLVLRALKQHTAGAGPDTLSERSLTVERTDGVQHPKARIGDVSTGSFAPLRSDSARSNPSDTLNIGDRPPLKRRRSSRRVEKISTAMHQGNGAFETHSVSCPRGSGRRISGSYDRRSPVMESGTVVGKGSIRHPAVELEEAVQLSDEGDIARKVVEMAVVEREPSRDPVRGNETKALRLRRKHVGPKNNYERERVRGRSPVCEGKTCIRITSKIARHREKRQQVITEMRVMAVALEQVGMSDLAWKYKTRLSTLRNAG